MISVVEGDLTAQEVDAVVNAASEMLQHGGGVAAAIVGAGGRAVQAESDAWIDKYGPLPPGQAAVTTGGSMPARWVIHVVGPRYRSGEDNPALLRQAVTAALEAAAGAGARSLAMPAISAGVFGYPRAEACREIVAGCRSFLAQHPNAFDEIRLVGNDAAATEDFRAALGD